MESNSGLTQQSVNNYKIIKIKQKGKEQTWELQTAMKGNENKNRI